MLDSKELLQRKQRGELLIREGIGRDIPKVRVQVLCTFNVASLPPYLVEALERVGLAGTVNIGPFGHLAQEILNDQSELYRNQPDIVVIVPAAEDLLTPLFQRPSQMDAHDMDALVGGRIEELRSWTKILLDRLPKASVFVVAYGTDRVPNPHILQAGNQRGKRVVATYVEGVCSLGELSDRVVVVDWDWHLREEGWAGFTDDRLWYLGRMRLNPKGLAVLSDLLAGHLAALRGMARKVLVLDLDNTLWGGVVGEVGLGGIQLGNEGIGLAFQEFQRELLRCHDMGVLLAVCSKNNPPDAWAVIEGHPGMVLKKEHFAATRINWQDKATNLREIAQELNLGLDSFVFLDDNPAEREWVSQTLPEVLVPPLPADPSDRPRFLMQSGFLQRLVVTEADRSRAASYRAAGLRKEIQGAAVTFDDFLASLQQEVEIAPLSAAYLTRAAQMCQRTNQFNLTTRRYTVADLEAMLADPNTEVFTLSVRDRFEDSGLTGLAVLRFKGDCAEIDTLLLSCRILGRKVEDRFVGFLEERTRKRGAKRLRGQYIPTARNGQAAMFYPDRQFRPVGEGFFEKAL